MLNMSVSEAVGLVLAVVAGLVALIKGIEYLIHKFGAMATVWGNKLLKPTNEKIDALSKALVEVENKATYADLASCKNFLVRFLADVEQGQPVDEVEITRFWETYDHYTRDLGKNSYICEKVASLKSQGKL